MTTEDNILTVPAPDAAMQAALKHWGKSAATGVGSADNAMVELNFNAAQSWGDDLVERFSADANKKEDPALEAQREDIKQQLKDAIESPAAAADPELKKKLQLALDSVSSGNLNPQALQAALNAANSALSDARVSSADIRTARQAEIAKLWDDVGQLNKDISNNLSTLADKGYIDDQTMEDLNEERARIDAMDPNDPKRVKAEEAYQSRVQGELHQAREAAQAANDQPAVNMIDDTLNDSKKADKKSKEFNELNQARVAAKKVESPNTPPATFPVADANKAENQSPSAAPKNTPPANDLGF